MEFEPGNGRTDLLATFQQLVGINIVFYYGAVLWQSVGFTEADALLNNVVSGTGLAVSGLAQWGSNFSVTITFPILLATVGLAGAYGLYTAAAVVSVAFVVKMVRETRGIELEDMHG